MDKSIGNVYTVIRPGDKAVVPLTCTEEQLVDWIQEGYVLADTMLDSKDVIEKS